MVATLTQKFVAGLMGLGALYLVFAKPEALYTAAKAARSLAAGSVVDVTTGGKGRTQY